MILISFSSSCCRSGRLDLPQQIAPVAAVLVIGPILLKMLIGHPFSDFRLEARRAAKA